MRRPAGSPLLQSIYFGGGTPSLLEPEQLERILAEILGGCVASADLEVTLEVNPEDVCHDRMVRFREAGINRVSLGVQSFEDEELQLLGRMHTGAVAEAAILHCHEAGLTNISIDLMFDQPGQTIERWQKSIATACGLPITHVSLYNLTIEPHTAFWRKRKLLESMQPKEAASEQMLHLAEQQLSAHGLSRYEISAFARSGYSSRHNLGYWLSRPFIGLGPSAWSDWDNLRFKNCANLVRWQQQIAQGISATDERDPLPCEARIRERFAIALRILSGICLCSWEQRFGSLSPAFRATLSSLVDSRLLRIADSRVMLSERGRMLYDEVASEIVCL